MGNSDTAHEPPLAPTLPRNYLESSFSNPNSYWSPGISVAFQRIEDLNRDLTNPVTMYEKNKS